MVLTLCCLILIIIFIVGLVRKCRECAWGKYNYKGNLKNQLIIVTGCNSGIGKEIVTELAKRKATVVLACRNFEAAKNVVEEISMYTPRSKLFPMELDLSSLESIQYFASEVLRKFSEIHVLINNAGVYVPLNRKEKYLTKEGFEIHFGVNHLGHFLLTNLLLDKLKQCAPSRIILVTSTNLESGNIDFNNLYGETELPIKGSINPQYCNSKLANVYFGSELAKRIRGTGVSVYMVCPGFCYTRLFRHVKKSWFHYILFLPIALLFLRTANQGAQTVLYCATNPAVINESGNVYKDCKIYKLKKKLNAKTSSKLWEVSAKLTKLSEASIR